MERANEYPGEDFGCFIMEVLGLLFLRFVIPNARTSSSIVKEMVLKVIVITKLSMILMSVVPKESKV